MEEQWRGSVMIMLIFTWDEGEVVCIVGESGCGKSAITVNYGTIRKGGARRLCPVDGKNLLEMGEKELDEIRQKLITI